MFALLAVLATLHLTAKDNHKSFTVKPQDAIVVTLASNPSTGYHWKLVPSAGEGRARLVSHRYVAPKTSRPGAAGKEIWRFRAFVKGITGISVVYVRPWQPNKPAREFGVTIRVS